MYQDKVAIGYASAVRGSRHTSKLSQLDRITPAFQERGKQQAVSRIPTVLPRCRSRVALSLRSKRMPLDPPINTDKRSALSSVLSAQSEPLRSLALWRTAQSSPQSLFFNFGSEKRHNSTVTLLFNQA